MNIPKINCTLNNNKAFKGMFLAEGSFEEINAIKNKFSSEEDLYRKSFPQPVNNLSNYESFYIMPKNAQPTKMFFATNKDMTLLDNFVYEHSNDYNNIYHSMSEKSFREINAEICLENENNIDIYLDMLNDKKKNISKPKEEAKKFVAQFLYENEISPLRFKQYKASEVLEAIKNNSFDFAGCVIKTKK